MPGGNCAFPQCTSSEYYKHTGVKVFQITTRKSEYYDYVGWRERIVNVLSKYRVIDKHERERIAGGKYFICDIILTWILNMQVSIKNILLVMHCSLIRNLKKDAGTSGIVCGVVCVWGGGWQKPLYYLTSSFTWFQIVNMWILDDLFRMCVVLMPFHHYWQIISLLKYMVFDAYGTQQKIKKGNKKEGWDGDMYIQLDNENREITTKETSHLLLILNKKNYKHHN